MAVRTVPGLRWACSGCGACCKAGYALGPIQQPTIDHLEASGIREIWPAAADGWYDLLPGPDGTEGAYLRTPEGSCIFLRPDNLCGIHAALGAEAKPWFCRRFPLAPLSDPEGAVVVVRPSCHGHYKVFDSAPELTQADLDEAVAITPAVRQGAFDRAVVEVLPGRGVSQDDWMYLEGRILGALEDGQSPWQAARAVRAELALAMPGGFPEPDPQIAEAAFQGTLQAFHRVLAAARAGTGGSPPHRERVEVVFASVERALRAERGERELTERAQAWLLVNLRSAVIGKEILMRGPVFAGLGLYLFGVELFARASAEDPVPVEAFGEPWSMWNDLLANRAMRAAVQVVTPALVDRAVRA